MLRHYVRVLEATVANPDQPIGEIDVMGPDERGRVLRAWNDSTRPVPERQSLPYLKSRYARRRMPRQCAMNRRAPPTAS